MTGPIPHAYVCAHLHGGPHDGETRQLPWARIEIPVLTWDGHKPETSIYQPDPTYGPWRGQEIAHYAYAGPAVEVEEEAA